MTRPTPQTGDTAPSISLPDQSGRLVDLERLRGSPVVVYFYPRASTPGCTQESQDFRDLASEFAALGAHILGISRDTVKSQKKFADKYQLPFPLLSDHESDVCDRYGVYGEKTLYGRLFNGITRATFLIDRNGVIARLWPKVSVKGHAAEVLEACRAL